ncbi:hypothetical protein ACSV5N_08050 [Agrobacterium salinitolerans]|uniref:hypothetical protein n=1 Tax=Agrobacterium salinitolerans TaxID=1183413 RepID=UPI00098F738F|nr:hypothetical protein [Agrobacterium salinitolerans]OOO16767.1 hypothetical protein BS627_21430 [Agrobacterium salinitolerans]PNQ20692.1 hypothetical protein C2E26_21775 [Rhizobium sp. YIC5082]
MPRIRNGSMLVGAMFIANMGLFSVVANAQNVETAPQQTPSVESGATGGPVKAADETTAAFLNRVNTSNPDTVSIATAELFKQSPTQGMISDLITIASSTDAATADVTGKVTSGFPIIAVSTSAAQFSEQLSGLILSDSGQLPTIVALAQKVGNKDFSEVVGEGLALAHATAMRNGNTILAAAIQLQTKGANVPADLLIAFSENIQGTAAGPAAPAAAAATASPIGGAGSSPASANSIGGSGTAGAADGTAQAGGGSAPVGGGGSGGTTGSTGTSFFTTINNFFSTGSTTTPVSTSPV